MNEGASAMETLIFSDSDLALVLQVNFQRCSVITQVFLPVYPKE